MRCDAADVKIIIAPPRDAPYPHGMSKKPNPEQVNVRLTADEVKALALLTKREERTRSDVVRRLIRKAAAEVPS